jgi:hypothetical protein
LLRHSFADHEIVNEGRAASLLPKIRDDETGWPQAS